MGTPGPEVRTIASRHQANPDAPHVVICGAGFAGLSWPHYFVDLSGVGGSADPAGDLVVIAACAQLAPGAPVSASPSATPSSSAVSAPAQAATSPASPGQASPGSSTPSPDVSPSASSAPGQGCLRPELVALNL